MAQIISDLVNCNEFESSLHQFFVDIQNLLNNDQFNEGFGEIAMESLEMSESFIYNVFLHVGKCKS